MTQISAHRLDKYGEDTKKFLFFRRIKESDGGMSEESLRMQSRICGISEIEIMTYFRQDRQLLKLENGIVSLGEKGEEFYADCKTKIRQHAEEFRQSMEKSL